MQKSINSSRRFRSDFPPYLISARSDKVVAKRLRSAQRAIIVRDLSRFVSNVYALFAAQQRTRKQSTLSSANFLGNWRGPQFERSTSNNGTVVAKEESEQEG